MTYLLYGGVAEKKFILSLSELESEREKPSFPASTIYPGSAAEFNGSAVTLGASEGCKGIKRYKW
jgi:hypothetical protein